MVDSIISEMSIDKAIDVLADIYINMVKLKASYKTVPSPFLWGPPGVGKSDGVRLLAEKIEKGTGKKVVVTDIRLLLFSPIDLRGVPVADPTRTFTDWLKPRILDFDPSEDAVNILFLDELSAASASVQTAAYQITLDRKVGEHELPGNTIVIAAGNRPSDSTAMNRMSPALANRMMHFNICADYTAWKNWALNKGNVHPLVLGFIASSVDNLYCFEKGSAEQAFPSPRSWMFVSNILNLMGDGADISKLREVIAGCVGMGAAIEFVAWCRSLKDLPKAEDVFAGRYIECPESPDTLHALLSSMSAYAIGREQAADGTELGEEGTKAVGVKLGEDEAKASGKGLSSDEINNLCRFCEDIPVDYAVGFYKTMLPNEHIKKKIIRNPLFRDWGRKHRRALASAGYEV